MEDLRQLQKACSTILFKFDEVCRNNNLTYYLAYGTLIGAVRHEGFIPWDDDIDVFMPRNDMQKIIEHFDEWFSDNLCINHYTSPNFTSNSFVLRICNPKVRFLRSIGGNGREFDSFISIFPIFGVPKSAIKRYLFVKKIENKYTVLRFVRSSNNGYGDVKRSFKENLGVVLNKLFRFGKGHNVREYVHSIDKLFWKYPYGNCDKVGVFTFGIYPTLYEKKWFGEPINMKYEGRELYVPSNYDEILKMCYGDYMALPPEESRKPKHSYKIITT